MAHIFINEAPHFLEQLQAQRHLTTDGIYIYRCSAASISIKSPGEHSHLDAVAPQVAMAAIPLPQGPSTERGCAPRCRAQTCGYFPEWVNDGTLTSQVKRLHQAINDATTLTDWSLSGDLTTTL